MRNLRHRKARRRRQLAVLEGARLIEEALNAAIPFKGVLATPAALEGASGRHIAQLAADGGITVEPIAVETFAGLADTDSPQGLMAVVELGSTSLGAIVPGAATPVLVLDGVQDPGNAGTMIRSAYALGSPGVIALPGTVDLLNPKVLRSSMGAIFRFPVGAAGHAEFAAWCAASGVELWAGATDGTDVATAVRGEGPCAVVVGNEGAGLSEETARLVAELVRIPIVAGAESLNVGVAAAILLYELRHRRRSC